MAVLDASNSEIAFTHNTAFALFIGGGAGSYQWQTTGGHRVTAFGAGFTYDASNNPTGGTVTSLEFDFQDASHPIGVVDATLTGISVPLADLVNPFNPAAGEIRFWETVLGGDDTITAPRINRGLMSGDFTDVVSNTFSGISRTGGDDTLTATAPVFSAVIGLGGGRSQSRALVGDALFVQGVANGQIANFAEVIGGDDTLRLFDKAAYVLVGDVVDVGELGVVHGGRDTIRSDVTVISSFGGHAYIGDVGSNFGDVIGGNDSITGTNFAFTDEGLVGDVLTARAGTVRGGADMLIGRAGQEIIAGDVNAAQGGAITGGADLVRGGEDSDIIAGDVLRTVVSDPSVNLFTLAGGADLLLGDNGNDWIAGDLWSAENTDPASLINGGADSIYGGMGDDTLYGDIDGAFAALLDVGGNDTIDGGLGDDLIDGQLGIDTAAFSTEAAAVVADLLIGTATGQGADTLAGIENLVGSALNDYLRGDQGANRLLGGAGIDNIVGRQGNDVLFGQDGNDVLNGGAGADTMVGGAGADIFVEGPLVNGAVTNDSIADFQNGVDRIDLKAYGFAGFAAVQALTTATGSGIKIDVPGAEVLFVTGLTLATFDASDVILV
jgi:Ca2+-binding RTX toxin-like protein